MKKIRKAFTMVELLVVMSVISILTTIHLDLGSNITGTAKSFQDTKIEKIARETFYNAQLEVAKTLNTEEKTFTVDNFQVAVSQGLCGLDLTVRVEVKKDNVVAVLDSCDQNYANLKAKVIEV